MMIRNRQPAGDIAARVRELEDRVSNLEVPSQHPHKPQMPVVEEPQGATKVVPPAASEPLERGFSSFLWSYVECFTGKGRSF